MTATEKQLYYRLIALWAVCEGVLGGIIHGFQIPVSGLFVGGAAVVIICMMGFYVPQKGAILQATLLVEIFKMMLSPQSPLPAYLAVAFQGVMGELFFFNKKFYKISCVLFAAIALFESAIQRIITMTLIYSNAFWKAMDAFINGITGETEITRYSYYIAGGYVVLHIAAGIAIGVFAAGIPSRLNKWKQGKQFLIPAGVKNSTEIQLKRNRKKIWKNSLLVIWVVLLFFFLQSTFHIGKPLLAADAVLQILVRSFLILLTWYFLVSPVLLYFLKKYLSRQKEKSQGTINEIVLLIPSTRLLIENSWKLSAQKKGLRRFNFFIQIILVNAFDDIHD